MTATQIIDEIETLPPQEQVAIIRFAYRLDAERQLTGPELSSLAQRMVTCTDSAENAKLREVIAHAFYGGKVHA